MTDFIDVVEHNPIAFVKAIVEKLSEGYVVQNTIAGFPHFGTHVNMVRLFKGERQGVTKIAEDHNGMVEHYEPMHFLLLLESFVANGYTFKEDGAHYIDERSLKSIQMELVKEEPKAAKTPAKKAPAKKALQAEPTIDELKGDE
ncbi:hypothetical protein QGX12_gp046 [Pseudomonas phage Kremar]|uniref:Uncharacterized protein n=1 Tax=Pseudomonas phage Kremar TaxID=2928831 RepID=A0AAE9KES4_9CAUD|nr:hypothetical protein QGX12_gp046 [Pseudomonas phage Kremar]UOL48469.1 hypothetical protein [Pseudomonas phage Kremar]